MDTAVKIGKGLLKLTWFLVKTAAQLAIAVNTPSKKRKAPHCAPFMAQELFDKEEITYEEFHEALEP
ncbi:MAG: hypothetical protein H0U57_05960 [Tatlockia sp.]|nr:hypothetical protein [Tatlockia sp.]